VWQLELVEICKVQTMPTFVDINDFSALKLKSKNIPGYFLTELCLKALALQQ